MTKKPTQYRSSKSKKRDPRIGQSPDTFWSLESYCLIEEKIKAAASSGNKVTVSKNAAIREARDGYRPKMLMSKMNAFKAKLRAKPSRRPSSSSPVALPEDVDSEVVKGTTGEDSDSEDPSEVDDKPLNGADVVRQQGGKGAILSTHQHVKPLSLGGMSTDDDDRLIDETARRLKAEEQVRALRQKPIKYQKISELVIIPAGHEASDEDLSSFFRLEKARLGRAGLWIKSKFLEKEIQFGTKWSIDELIDWVEAHFPRITQWQKGQYAAVSAEQVQGKGKERALTPRLLLPAFAKYTHVERLDIDTCDAGVLRKNLPKGRMSSGRVIFVTYFALPPHVLKAWAAGGSLPALIATQPSQPSTSSISRKRKAADCDTELSATSSARKRLCITQPNNGRADEGSTGELSDRLASLRSHLKKGSNPIAQPDAPASPVIPADDGSSNAGPIILASDSDEATDGEYIGNTSSALDDTSQDHVTDLTSESDIDVISISSGSARNGSIEPNGKPEGSHRIDLSVTELKHAYFPLFLDGDAPFENPFELPGSEDSMGV